MKKALSEEILENLDYAKKISSEYPDKSMDICQEAYLLAKEYNLVLEEGYALLGMVFASRIKSDRSKMLDYSFKALEIFEAENHIAGQIKTLNLIGVAYFYSSMYEEALKYFLKVNDLLEFNKDDFLLSSILNNIGEVYRESEIYDKAMEYYRKAIDIAFVNNYSLNHASILGNIGDIHFAKQEFDIALEVYNQGYDILINGNDIVSLGEIENRIGKVYFVIGEFKKAEEYYFKSYKRLETISNKYYIIDVLKNLAQLYIVNESDKVLDYYEKAIEFAENVGSKKKLCQIYKLISEYYEKVGDYINSLDFYKKYSNINEEILSSNLRTKLEILNIELRNIEITGKFEQVRSRLEEEINRQKEELEKIILANEILQKKAYEDELTGVSNRRSINIYLNKIIEEMSSKEDLISLFMMDIDNFKKYNDYWGHSEGDVCIRKIADCIKRIQNNRSDFFGRYGGEEFVYISISPNFEEALKLGNLIRTEVEKIGLYYMDRGEKKPVTISIGGVMGSSSDFSSMANMMELADKELYKAKEKGKNRTILKDMKTSSENSIDSNEEIIHLI